MCARYIYELEVRHEGLKKYRLIRGSDRHVVEQKAWAQKAIWNEMWEKRSAGEEKRSLKQQSAELAQQYSLIPSRFRSCSDSPS